VVGGLGAANGAAESQDGGGGRWPTRPRLIWGPDASAGTGIRTVD